MTVGSCNIAFRVFCLRFQSSFSVVSCWSLVSKNTGSSCVMPVVPVDSMFTSFGFFGKSSLTFEVIFSVLSISQRNKKSAVVFIFPGTCAMVKLNCNTKAQAFHKGGGIIFVWKNPLNNLLSVMIIIGMVGSQNICPISLKAR